ncbi:MAG: hypothetical protein QOJ02_1347, partial [Acidobacteriota bacterium]|nr:hypothetical protein [Acidobacteriota bacterium]
MNDSTVARATHLFMLIFYDRALKDTAKFN